MFTEKLYLYNSHQKMKFLILRGNVSRPIFSENNIVITLLHNGIMK